MLKKLHKYIKSKLDIKKSNTFKRNHQHKIRSIPPFIIIIFLVINVVMIELILYLSFSITENILYEVKSPNIKTNPYPKTFSEGNFLVSSRSFIILEKESRVIVSSSNENLTFSPASTAKIMTALVALENYSLDTILETNFASLVEGSRMGLFQGERISVSNLLYGLLLPSGNDAAYVLAQNYPGGIYGFINRMNEKAAELLLSKTHFSDPSGYDDKNVTSAFDLARLASYALSNPEFSKIVRTKEKLVYNENFIYSHKLINLNKLLYKDGVNGIKTGFTEDAGGVLVTSFEFQGKTYVVVVMKSEDRFLDTDALIENIVKKVKLISFG